MAGAVSQTAPVRLKRLAQVPTAVFADTDVGEKVAACKGGHNFPDRSDKEAATNAAFIERAWNCHHDLVKALQDALCELSACANQLSDLGRNVPVGGSINRAIVNARTALAAAKSESA